MSSSQGTKNSGRLSSLRAPDIKKIVVKNRQQIRTIKQIREQKGNLSGEEINDPRGQPMLPDDLKRDILRTVKCLTRPGEVIVDISRDLSEIVALGATNDMIPGDCPKEKLLMFYARYTRRLYREISAILTSADLLNFKKARRILLMFFSTTNLKFGVHMKQTFRLIQDTNETISALHSTLADVDSEDDSLPSYVLHSLSYFKEIGIDFVVWVAHFKSSQNTPSRYALEANCRSMAKFAGSAQKIGLVPILSIEMEVNVDVNCTSIHQRNYDAILTRLVSELAQYRIFLEGLLLCIKVPNFQQSPPPLETSRPEVYRPETACTDECIDYSSSSNVMISRSVSICASVISRRVPPHIGGLVLPNQDSLKASLTQLSEMNRCPVDHWPTVTPCFSRVLLEGVADHYRKLTTWPPRYLSGHQRQYHSAALDSAGDRLVANIKECSLCAMGERHAADRLPVWVGVQPTWVSQCSRLTIVDDSC